MLDLDKTVKLMNSSDYKDRFKAEYIQTRIRYTKLRKMLISYEAGTLTFEPSCPISLLKRQLTSMANYLYILEVRAELECIDLFEK